MNETIYLDHAATSFPKLPGVAEAIAAFAHASAGNPGRSGHRLSRAADALVRDTRQALARLLGAPEVESLVFTAGATDALNQALLGAVALRAAQQPDQPVHVVMTDLDHNAVYRPLAGLQRAGRVRLTILSSDEQGFISPQAVVDALEPATGVVAIPHASNVLGTVQDLPGIGALVRDHGALLVVDAAQTVGSLTLELADLSVDLLAFPGHKGLGGPTGIGGLYVGPRVRAMPPLRTGGTGSGSQEADPPMQLPDRFEAGTANTFGLAGLKAALRERVRNPALAPDVSLARERQLAERFVRHFSDRPQLTIYGSTDFSRRMPVLAFNVQGLDAAVVAAILDSSFRIAVRSGLHCAPLIHQRLGTAPQGCVRASFGPLNTSEDADALIEAVEEILRMVSG